MSKPNSRILHIAMLVAFGLLFMAGCSGTNDGIRFASDGEVAEAVAARKTDPTEPYWSFRLAEYALQMNNVSGAQAHLDTALVSDPLYTPAAMLLSKTWYDAGKFEEAANLLQTQLANNAQAPDELRVALALNLQAMAQPDESAALLASCAKESDTVATAKLFAALQGDEYLTSLESAAQAVKENPNSAANHNNYGISLLYAGKPQEAREEFQKALALKPDLPGSLYNMAIVENFYFFDPTASNTYFEKYREVTKGHPLADPDDLGTLLGQDAQTAAVSVEVSGE